MLIGVEESVWRRRIRSGCEVGRAATDEANQGRAALRVKRFLAALAS